MSGTPGGHHRRRRALAAGWAAAALAATACALAAPTARAQTVHVGRRATRPPLPGGFLSLSVQFRPIERWTPPGQPVDPLLVQLVRNLDSGRPVIRVGGQGGDRTWWRVPHMRRPYGVSNTLSPRWTRAARRLAVALHARYLLQINLEAGSARLAHVEADHLVAGVGRRYIAALEIGNEPDLYDSIPWYWESGGHPLPPYAGHGIPVYARPPSYGPEQFVAQVRRFERVLPRGIPLAGPDLVSPAWLAPFAAMMTRHSRVRYLDVHTYPVEKCETDPASPKYPSPAHLLALSASRDLLAGLRPYVAQARRDHGHFIDDEMGADSCGGNAGVSNTMASALWVMDTLFAMDRAGVDGVDLHLLPSGVNAMFALSEHHGRWRARIYPVYLGALLFHQAAPARSRLLSVTGADRASLRTWATIAPDHRVRVLLINDGRRTVANVHVPRGYGSLPAAVERLRAPGAAATGGLVLAGHRFSRTSTGIPKLHPEQVRPRRGGYRIRMRGASAALVTFAPRG